MHLGWTSPNFLNIIYEHEFLCFSWEYVRKSSVISMAKCLTLLLTSFDKVWPIVVHCCYSIIWCLTFFSDPISISKRIWSLLEIQKSLEKTFKITASLFLCPNMKINPISSQTSVKMVIVIVIAKAHNSLHNSSQS